VWEIETWWSYWGTCGRITMCNLIVQTKYEYMNLVEPCYGCHFLSNLVPLDSLQALCHTWINHSVRKFGLINICNLHSTKNNFFGC
jgi:hypothetical protein